MDVRPSQARSAEPARLRIGAVRRGESWADLAKRATGNTRDAEAVANINGFDLNQPPQVGMMVKLPEEVVADR
jgi:predicted Zn-dependent protease